MEDYLIISLNQMKIFTLIVLQNILVVIQVIKVHKVTIPTTKITTEIKDQTTQILTEKISNFLSEDLINNTTCSKKDILKNKCMEGLITEEKMKELHNNIKESYLNSGFQGENIIIQTENVVFQISTLNKQKIQIILIYQVLV